jgi:hypothetical protein
MTHNTGDWTRRKQANANVLRGVEDDRIDAPNTKTACHLDDRGNGSGCGFQVGHKAVQCSLRKRQKSTLKLVFRQARKLANILFRRDRPGCQS